MVVEEEEGRRRSRPRINTRVAQSHAHRDRARPPSQGHADTTRREARARGRVMIAQSVPPRLAHEPRGPKRVFLQSMEGHRECSGARVVTSSRCVGSFGRGASWPLRSPRPGPCRCPTSGRWSRCPAWDLADGGDGTSGGRSRPPNRPTSCSNHGRTRCRTRPPQRSSTSPLDEPAVEHRQPIVPRLARRTART